MEPLVLHPYQWLVTAPQRCLRALCALAACLLLFSLPGAADARPFGGLSPTPVSIAQGAADGSAAWGDFDNDDDLDLLVTGIGNHAQRATLLFENEGGTLVVYNSGLPRAESSSADWGDYDNDGYLDVLLTGQVGYANGQIVGLAGVYRNVPHPTDNALRTFVLAFPLPAIYAGSGTWGDYNNDGRLDILLTGYSDGGAPLTRIYRNDGPDTTGGSLFSSTAFNFANLGSSQARWGDYNNDGFLDFVVMGREAGGGLRSVVYRNNSTTSFTAINGLTGMWGGAPAWIDADNDHDLDLLLTGNTGDNGANIQPATILYRYQNGAFTAISGTGLPAVWDSSISVGDYDNDGDADLLLNGLTRSTRPTAIYRSNRNFTFSDAGANLPSGASLSAAWGDFDNDRSLDVALTGITAGDAYSTHIYRSNNPPPSDNLPPSAPALVSACWNNGSRVYLQWTSASDDPGRASTLTYNLRMGTMPHGYDVFSPQANKDNGFRRVAQPGSLFAGISATAFNLPYPRNYYWAVQAVDPSLAGGGFSAEGEIDLGTRVANDNAYAATENTPITFNILANDNQGYAPLRVQSINTRPRNGTLVEETQEGTPEGTFTYTPHANWNGTDSFTYYAIGSTTYCSYATVTISVAAQDYPPSTILLTNASIIEGRPAGSYIGTFSATDPDPEDETFTFSLVPNGGNNYDNDLFEITGAELRSRAPLVYDPSHDPVINVQAADPDGLTVTERFTITVQPNTPVSIACVDCADFISPPKSARLAMSEDGSPTPFTLTLRADDPGPLETMTWSVTAAPAHGTLTCPATSLPGALLPVQYAPAPDWNGTDSFTLHVRDPLGNTDQIAVTVDVQPVNDPPSLGALGDVTYLEGSGEQQIALTGIGPGPLNETGQPLAITASASDPNLLHDLRVESPPGSSSATLRFRVEAPGQTTITITVDDGAAENSTTSSSFLVTVVPLEAEDPFVLFLPLVFGGQ